MSSDPARKSFPRSISSLENIFLFTGGFVQEHRIDDKVRFLLELSVEEFFTNMVKYNPEGKQDIELLLQRDRQQIHVTLVDPDSHAFDVTKDRKIDLTKSLTERKVGGLGVYLVKKMVDSLQYDYSNRKSSITFTLQLE